MTWSRPFSIWLAPALILALGLLVILFDMGGIESRLSHRQFDAFARHAPRSVGAVRVLELPDAGEDTLVDAARMLARQGAALAVFTAPLAPGPSPQSLAAKLPPGQNAARAALAGLPEPGHDFAQALRDIKAVVPVLLGVEGRAPQAKTRFVYLGARDPFALAPRFANAAAPLAVIQDNAAAGGAATMIADPDGVVRRVPVVAWLGPKTQGGLVPGIAAQALASANGDTAITVAGDESDPLSLLRGVGIASLQTKDGPVPTQPDGTVWLRYARDASARRIDAGEPQSLKGAIVVVGVAGAMAKTPPGMASIASITADAIEGLQTGQVLTRPDWLRLGEALALVALGAGLIWSLRFGLGWAAGASFAGVTVLVLGSWYLFVHHAVLADAVTPSLFLILAFAAAAAAWAIDMAKAHAGLRLAFADSLPRASIETIARRPELLTIEGESRSVTYLVCGVRAQDGMARMRIDDPQGFTSLMQKALTPLIDQALAHGGTIDRLTADGFATFWNAPLEDGDHALHACEAANSMAIMSARITEELAQEKRDAALTVEIGVGLATGPVVAGAFGGQGRMGYSVNGPAVELAARIQSLSRRYGPALIVSDATKRAAERGFAFLEIDTIADQDNRPVTLWAIMGNPVARASPKFRALTVFHDHIFQAIRKQQWPMARELIAQCRRLSGASQKLYDLHLARIAWYETHPPGPNWDGAFRQVLE